MPAYSDVQQKVNRQVLAMLIISALCKFGNVSQLDPVKLQTIVSASLDQRLGANHG